MKRTAIILLSLIGMLLVPSPSFGLSLSVYISQPTEKLLNPSTSQILRNRMDAIINASGAQSSSNSRFVIVPKITIIDENISSTIPAQDVVKIQITYCVGDGIDGRLYNTLDKTYTGIGENSAEAIKSAILKISPSSADFKKLISEVSGKVINHYNEVGDQIIHEARILASNARYEDAIRCLNDIPSGCRYYNEASDLELDYAGKIVKRNNLYWLNKAKSTWSSSQDLYGANEACGYLDNIIITTKTEQNEVNQLISKINDGIKSYNESIQQLQFKKIESETTISIAKSEARANIVASIANAAASIIPNIIGW